MKNWDSYSTFQHLVMSICIFQIFFHMWKSCAERTYAFITSKRLLIPATGMAASLDCQHEEWQAEDPSGHHYLSAVKPAWLHIKSTGTGISAHGGNGRATWSLCQESGVKTHFSPPVWGPWGQTWSQQSQHIPPCWQLPSDLAFTLQTVRLGITHHLPKDGVASLAPLQKHSASKGAQDRVFLLSVSPGVNGEASLTLV